jgi:16S rRNA (cytidine1402-2'-O)-methyltransferase
LYEAPHRIRQTLEDMLAIFGDRVVALGRELTKAHEELVVRPISGHLDLLAQEKGEFTLIVSGNRPKITPQEDRDPETAAAAFRSLTIESGKTRREALRVLASEYDIPAREVFALLERAKKSVG